MRPVSRVSASQAIGSQGDHSSCRTFPLLFTPRLATTPSPLSPPSVEGEGTIFLCRLPLASYQNWGEGRIPADAPGAPESSRPSVGQHAFVGWFLTSQTGSSDGFDDL
jgi:hypothetical protein